MGFKLPTSLEDELVLLRPLVEQDAEALYEVAKDPLIWEQHPCSDRYQRDAYQSFFEDSIASKLALVVIDKANQKVIGSSRFKLIDGVDTAVEIGWSFLERKCWGGSYNRSVKALMMEYAFQFVDDIIFYIGKENIRSQKAVEKIGGIRIVEQEYQYLILKSDTDITYRINNGDYQKRLKNTEKQ